MARLLLEPNSLLVLKGESRYMWTHGIAERKHDIVPTVPGERIAVKQRSRRISLTFRKVKERAVVMTEGKPTQAEAKPNELVLPKTEREAVEFERCHVHQVYNQIASHFSQTRYSAWPGVSTFINAMQPYSTMLDVGCGNGKYLGLRRDLFCVTCFILSFLIIFFFIHVHQYIHFFIALIHLNTIFLLITRTGSGKTGHIENRY